MTSDDDFPDRLHLWRKGRHVCLCGHSSLVHRYSPRVYAGRCAYLYCTCEVYRCVCEEVLPEAGDEAQRPSALRSKDVNKPRVPPEQA